MDGRCDMNWVNLTGTNGTNISTLTVCKITANVNSEVTLMFSLLSFISYISLTGVLFLYSYGDSKHLGMPYTICFLCFAFISTITSNLSYQESEILCYSVSTVIVVFIFGIGVTFIAGYRFFDIRRSVENMKALGHGHENITDFLWIITKVIVLLELMLFIGALAKKDSIAAILVASGLFQKVGQAWLYKFSLQYKIPAKNKFYGASWYFKMLALFNFSLWLESIMIADKQGDDFIKGILKDGNGIFSSSYAALLIDYRLVCCILFIEHAIKVDAFMSKKKKHVVSRSATPGDELFHGSIVASEKFKADTYFLAGCGYVFGMVLFALQIINALQYSYLKPWTNIFGIAADVTIVIAGHLLLKQVVRTEGDENITPLSVGVDILMATMGIFGIIYWCLKGTMTAIWASRSHHVDRVQYSYLWWNSFKHWCKPMSIAFQVYLFLKVDIHSACMFEMKKRKRNHFVVTVLMTAFMSVFLNAIIDAYTGTVDTLTKHSDLNIVFMTIYKCGSPLHLGFCLHLFLHFYTINGKFIASRKTTTTTTTTTSPSPPITNNGNMQGIFGRDDKAHYNDDEVDDKSEPLLQNFQEGH